MKKLHGPQRLILIDSLGGKLEVVTTFKHGIAHTAHKAVAEAWQSRGAIVSTCGDSMYRIIAKKEVQNGNAV